MNMLSRIKQAVRATGYAIDKIDDTVYDQDGLRTRHNHQYMENPRFQEAYKRGVLAAGQDYNWHWRVHIGLWTAANAAKLPGDFVECGVNRGFLSSAIMRYLDWDALGKKFYLLDTFAGVDERFTNQAEINQGVLERNQAWLDDGFYVQNVDIVVENFSEWSNIRIIQGSIPDTLDQVDAAEIAYLHLDLNAAVPEAAAFEYFWDRLTPGGHVLMDDYAYFGFDPQKSALDAVIDSVGANPLSLPTGQGLVIKSP